MARKAISLGVDGVVCRTYRGCCRENALIYPKVEAFMREELERKGVGNEQRRITFFGQLRDIFIGARVEGGSGFTNLMGMESVCFDGGWIQAD